MRAKGHIPNLKFQKKLATSLDCKTVVALVSEVLKNRFKHNNSGSKRRTVLTSSIPPPQ